MRYPNRYLSFSIVLVIMLSANLAHSQDWIKDSTSLYPEQYGNPGSAINVKFKCPGPLGKCWMYGRFWDQDSIRRVAAYREGGKWVPLPITGHRDIVCSDMAQIGDTLVLGGGFSAMHVDSGSQIILLSNFLKFYDDSLWSDPRIFGLSDIETLGDTILIWGYYADSFDTIQPHIISYDGGQTYKYPYNIIHPYLNYPDFGPSKDLEILANGSIYTIINCSPRVNPFAGSMLWDGSNWTSLGNGLYGWSSQSWIIKQHQKTLYMGGSFRKSTFPNDPADGLARWNGTDWENVGGGLSSDVYNMFSFDSLLCVEMYGSDPGTHIFGDLKVPYLAGWDGNQWCGTPAAFSSTPNSFGVIGDTLFVSFLNKAMINGKEVGYLAYFNGDYFKGPFAQCSTPGLSNPGQECNEDLIPYPNPTTNTAGLRMNIIPNKVAIFDIKGVLVREWIQSKHLILEDIPPGLYIISIESNSGLQKHKLIINE